MSHSLHASQAARQLGVSRKALRLYEAHGLVRPGRTAAGWRVYGPRELARAAEVVALRALGLGLAQIARVQAGDATAIAAHQAALEAQHRQLAARIAEVEAIRRGGSPARLSCSFALPWPWGGEPFALALRPLTYITGPLGCGKTRLAMRLAEVLPGAAFLPMERDRPLHDVLAADDPAILVIDLVEHGLDRAGQEALGIALRQHAHAGRTILMTTRSSVIVDLAALGDDEAVIYCPANHAPPMLVAPHAGAPGYEAVASCLASPEVRARTRGVIAWRPPML